MRHSLTVTAALCAAARAATINDVQPNKGSLAGGTYVTIWGDGFFRNGQDGTTRGACAGRGREAPCCGARAGVGL